MLTIGYPFSSVNNSSENDSEVPFWPMRLRVYWRHMEKIYFPESTYARTFPPPFALSSAWDFMKIQSLVPKQLLPKIRGPGSDTHMKQCRDSLILISFSCHKPLMNFLSFFWVFFIWRQKNFYWEHHNLLLYVRYCILYTGNISAAKQILLLLWNLFAKLWGTE